MQIKDHFLLSKKQYEDEQEAETSLKKDLEKWFSKLLNSILDKLDDNYNPYTYLFQVEEMVKDYASEYNEILSENIHDYYIQHSETIEAKINNKVAQKTLDNTLLVYTANKKQTKIDDFYNYQTTNSLNEQIKKKLRFNNNVQHSLDRYITYELDIGFIPSDFTIEELLAYEVDQAVVEYMADNVFVASESTLNRVTQQIYDVITESYAERGEGINKVTQDIQEKFNELRQFEAERIARTETLKAQGNATYNRLVNNDNVEYMQWVATNDERTRDSHAEIDGEITYADDTGIFSNGLKHPGDTDGDIEEWINCRCDIVAFVPDVGMVAPGGVSNWFEDDMVFDNRFDIPEVNVELDEYLASWW